MGIGRTAEHVVSRLGGLTLCTATTAPCLVPALGASVLWAVTQGPSSSPRFSAPALSPPSPRDVWEGAFGRKPLPCPGVFSSPKAGHLGDQAPCPGPGLARPVAGGVLHWDVPCGLSRPRWVPGARSRSRSLRPAGFPSGDLPASCWGCTSAQRGPSTGGSAGRAGAWGKAPRRVLSWDLFAAAEWALERDMF